MTDINNFSPAGSSRRRFLQKAGAFTSIGLFLAACHKDSTTTTTPVTSNPDAPGVNSDGSINLGGHDIGILNYAYALEQIESAFYERAIQSQYSGITSDEVAALTEIRDVEALHREFLKKALGSNAIQTLDLDFSSIDFSNRNIVLNAAKTFEDTGISAYNGSGRLLTDPSNLAVAGKIVSVEARNATYIRHLLGETFFTGDNAVATVIDGTTGEDLSRRPTEVLPIVKVYLKSVIDASHLPTY